MTIKTTIRPSMLNLKIVNNLFINKKGITIKDLAKNLKTDYKNVYDSVIALFGGGIIKKEKIGNYNICKLNYSNEDVIEYLKEYNFYVRVKGFRKKYPIEYRIITEMCEKLRDEFSELLFICLIFGSYSMNEEKEGSDIDLLFLIEGINYSFEKEIKGILSKVNLVYQKKFHVNVQPIKDFTKDIKNKDKLSISTELLKQPPIVFYGDDLFFRIMVKANKLW